MSNASGQTENFGLSQWSADDYFCHDDFNEDNLKIDAALATMFRGFYGSYAGSGDCGAGDPCVLHFPKPPKMLVIMCKSQATRNTVVVLHGQSEAGIFPGYGDSAVPKNRFTWGADGTVSWYNSDATPSADKQMNAANTQYHYFALC